MKINKKILLVDDNDGQRITLESILKRSGFEVVTADCGNAALSAAEKEPFAAVLLDIKMPDITGIDVLKIVKKNQPDVTVLMMTGYSDTDYAIEALNAGASAFLLKPANIEQIKMLLAQALEHQRLIEENRSMSAALIEQKQALEKKVAERTAQLAEANRLTLGLYEELKKNFESTLEVLSIAIDQRDPLTSSHSFRVTEYAVEIGKLMRLDSFDLEKLRYAGLMHDLGKIEIGEQILTKEGSLTSYEYREIQTHAQGTYELLSKFKFKGDLSDVPLIAASHHEHYDGTGYPRKLKGDEIPLLARVLALADVLDAITSKRHYRTAMSIKDALMVIKRETGGHFDPAVAEALFGMHLADFVKIHMAEHLSKIDLSDLIELGPVTLKQLYEATQKTSHTPEDLHLLNMFHHYYQGPVPSGMEHIIKDIPAWIRDAA